MERASGVVTGTPCSSNFVSLLGASPLHLGSAGRGSFPQGGQSCLLCTSHAWWWTVGVCLRMDKPVPRPLCPRLRFTLPARVPHWASPLSPTQREALQWQRADSPYGHSGPEWGANLPLSLFQRENAPGDILADYSPSRMK